MTRYETGSGWEKEFWEVVSLGNSVRIYAGRAGTDGQVRKSIAYGDAEWVARDVARRIEVQRRLGYRLVREVFGTHARNPELEAAIREAPDDDDVYLVYGDWLQSQGDPRGELVALQHSRAAQPDDRALAAAEEGLLGARWRELVPASLRKRLHKPGGATRRGRTSPDCEIAWRCGFIHRARLARTRSSVQLTVRQLLNSLLAHPSSALLQQLVIGALGGAGDRGDYQPVVDALIECAPASLRRLHMADVPRREVASPASCAPGVRGLPSIGSASNFVGFGMALPRLERLDLSLREVRFSASLYLPSLRSLSVSAANLDEQLGYLMDAPWPNLVELALDSGGVESAPDAWAATIAGARLLPELRRLSLANVRGAAALIASLARAPWWSQLESLALPGGDLSDADADGLLSRRAVFSRLSRLEVPANTLSPAAVAALADLGPEISAEHQRYQPAAFREAAVNP